MLPDRSLFILQILAENAKIQKLKCDILGNIQTLLSNFIEFVRHFWPLLTIVEAKVSHLFHIQKLIWAKGLTNVQSVPKSQGNLLPVVKVSRNKLVHWVPNNRKPNGLHSNKLSKIDEMDMSIIG